LLFLLLLRFFFGFLHSLLLPHMKNKANFLWPENLFRSIVGLLSSFLEILVASTLTFHPLAKLMEW
jgi:hypothetical protein